MIVDMIIKNGTIVLPRTNRQAHVIIHDGKIMDIIFSDELPETLQTIDVRGLHVLPGLIDPHVHFREPGLAYKEDFTTGSAAAACGGITCVNDMPNVVPPTLDVQAFHAKLSSINGRSYVDYGLYGVLVAGNTNQILPLAEAGIIGFKIFMGETVGQILPPSDGEILDAWSILRETGLRCGVHAENQSILAYLREKYQKLGRKDPLVHFEARPSIAEAECINRAILFAEHCRSKLMIYHMSAREGVALLREAKQRDVDVMGETAPHYLMFAAEDMVRKGLGSLLKVNPPIRTEDHAEALWEGLREGTIEVIGSDHAPHTANEKRADERFSDIWQVASGLIGVETSLPLMLTQVHAGKLTLNQLVKVQAEGPARAWNLWPKKGNLDPGADGDVTIVDMNKEGIIDKNRLHSKSKVTPYHGWRIKGMPVYTIVRGNIVAKDGEVVGNPIGQLQRPIV
jgi:dihydroorotase